MAAAGSSAIHAQDPSSQLVAVIAARLMAPGGRFVDLCAAPGGNAARVLRESDCELAVACDLRLGRALMARSPLARSTQCSFVVCDSVRPPLEPRAYDLVLIDAPCSGTGTLRRHPELRWRLQPERIVELVALQGALITAGLELLAPSGVVVYATCSVEPEENEQLLRAVPGGFEPLDLAGVVPPGVPSRATDAAGIRILPHLDGDGFTIHAVRRRDELPVAPLGSRS
jgi:16S rRNA (cytosine967-C5)-methyltransferase